MRGGNPMICRPDVMIRTSASAPKYARKTPSRPPIPESSRDSLNSAHAPLRHLLKHNARNGTRDQSHPHSSQQALPLSPSAPSFPIIGTIASPAAGSAHHQPNRAFSSKPPKRIPERYVQKSACRESALMGLLPIVEATRRLALANSGMTTSEAAAIKMPGILRSGATCRTRLKYDSPAM